MGYRSWCVMGLLHDCGLPLCPVIRVMRKLTDRELDLLVNGANSLASSWKLKALIEEIKNDPGVIEAGKKHGR